MAVEVSDLGVRLGDSLLCVTRIQRPESWLCVQTKSVPSLFLMPQMTLVLYIFKKKRQGHCPKEVRSKLERLMTGKDS